MARYIDADKLESFLRVELSRTERDSLSLAELDFFITALRLTEDVAPVVHAHWIKEEDCTAVTDIPWSMCSACGSYSLKLPYCAFCGAKMDEELEIDE